MTNIERNYEIWMSHSFLIEIISYKSIYDCYIQRTRYFPNNKENHKSPEWIWVWSWTIYNLYISKQENHFVINQQSALNVITKYIILVLVLIASLIFKVLIHIPVLVNNRSA